MWHFGLRQVLLIYLFGLMTGSFSILAIAQVITLRIGSGKPFLYCAILLLIGILPSGIILIFSGRTPGKDNKHKGLP